MTNGAIPVQRFYFFVKEIFHFGYHCDVQFDKSEQTRTNYNKNKLFQHKKLLLMDLKTYLTLPNHLRHFSLKASYTSVK